MILPKGITGFFEHEDESVPGVDGREFSRACYEVAREKGGRLTGIQAQPYGPFVVVPAAVLSLEPEKEHLKQRSRAELDQIRYWMPHRLGDIVFNRWD